MKTNKANLHQTKNQGYGFKLGQFIEIEKVKCDFFICLRKNDLAYFTAHTPMVIFETCLHIVQLRANKAAKFITQLKTYILLCLTFAKALIAP